MPRPHRPNPTPKSESRTKRALTRVKQETRPEMKARKYREAEARSPMHTIPNKERGLLPIT